MAQCPVAGRARRAAAPAVLAGSCLVVAVRTVGYLALTSATSSPIFRTVSDNAVVPGAGLLDADAVFVVLGSAALLADVLAVGCSPLMAPTGAWCAELIVAALFPIGRPNTAMSLSGTVHRYAGATMSPACLPSPGQSQPVR